MADEASTHPTPPAPSSQSGAGVPPAPGSVVATPAAKPAARAPADLSRRNFLGMISWTSLGWASFAAASGTGSVAMGRFMFPNVLYELPATVKVGFPDEYAEGTVEEKFKDSNGVWIVRFQNQIFALISVCTHLGCTPNWLQNEDKIKCPCHGSGFRKSGINFEGPAPRALERAKIALLDDGQILVDKSKKFLFEKGEWTDPESFLAVT